MNFQFLFLAIGMTIASASIGAEALSIDAALARADTFEREMKFADEVAVLQPFADSANAKVESSLAFAYMELAIEGKQPGTISEEAIRPAIDFAQRAIAHGGSAIGYNLLALIYSNGWGVPVDSAKGADYLRHGAEAGEHGAKLNLAIAQYSGAPAIPRDIDNACRLFFGLVRDDAQDVLAVYYVGLLEFRGLCGRPADKAAGVEMFKIAAEHGVRDAERDMGKSFEFGWVEPKDMQKAFDWYEKAADHGDPDSQWWIGMAYVNGVLVPKDSVKGVKYLEQSAASDYSKGLVDLGVMYVTGDGVAKDFDRARSLYERAAAQEEPHAFRELAAMYANGEGVPVDLMHSRLLYLQSVELGEADVTAYQTLFKTKLDATQLQESDRQFEAWRKNRAAK